jgi:hypothetical protein
MKEIVAGQLAWMCGGVPGVHKKLLLISGTRLRTGGCKPVCRMLKQRESASDAHGVLWTLAELPLCVLQGLPGVRLHASRGVGLPLCVGQPYHEVYRAQALFISAAPQT